MVGYIRRHINHCYWCIHRWKYLRFDRALSKHYAVTLAKRLLACLLLVTLGTALVPIQWLIVRLVWKAKRKPWDLRRVLNRPKIRQLAALQVCCAHATVSMFVGMTPLWETQTQKFQLVAAVFCWILFALALYAAVMVIRSGPGRVPSFLKLPSALQAPAGNRRRSNSNSAVSQSSDRIIHIGQAVASDQSDMESSTPRCGHPTTRSNKPAVETKGIFAKRGYISQRLYEARMSANDPSISVAIRTWAEDAFLGRTEQGSVPNCRPCRHLVPDRAGHCSDCGTCSLGMQKHSFLLGTLRCSIYRSDSSLQRFECTADTSLARGLLVLDIGDK